MTLPEFEELHRSCMRIDGREKLEGLWVGASIAGSNVKELKKIQKHYQKVGQDVPEEDGLARMRKDLGSGF